MPSGQAFSANRAVGSAAAADALLSRRRNFACGFESRLSRAHSSPGFRSLTILMDCKNLNPKQNASKDFKSSASMLKRDTINILNMEIILCWWICVAFNIFACSTVPNECCSNVCHCQRVFGRNSGCSLVPMNREANQSCGLFSANGETPASCYVTAIISISIKSVIFLHTCDKETKSGDLFFLPLFYDDLNLL